MNRRAAPGELNDTINSEGSERKNGYVGRNLTTHSTGGSIEWLSSSKDCSQVEGFSLAPVNAGVRLLPLVMFGGINMRKMLLGAWFIGVFIFSAHEVVCQCKCAHVPGSTYLTAHEALKTSDVVFTGEIVEVKKGASADEYGVNFKIKSVWKKDVGESVVLRTYRVSCGFFGEEGDKYLVYAYVREGALTTNGCTRTTPLAKASADLKEFEEKGEKPIKVYDTESR
jgi:hypothetical protein